MILNVGLSVLQLCFWYNEDFVDPKMSADQHKYLFIRKYSNNGRSWSEWQTIRTEDYDIDKPKIIISGSREISTNGLLNCKLVCTKNKAKWDSMHRAFITLFAARSRYCITYLYEGYESGSTRNTLTKLTSIESPFEVSQDNSSDGVIIYIKSSIALDRCIIEYSTLYPCDLINFELQPWNPTS